MKPGQQIKCPHCGKDSFLVKKSLMDGWKKIGDILACSTCSEKIGDYDEKLVRQEDPKNLSSLEQLLSQKKAESLKMTAEDDEKHFCRDCLHFVSHPFLSRCGLHNRNVEPMEDCPQYEKKKE